MKRRYKICLTVLLVGSATMCLAASTAMGRSRPVGHRSVVLKSPFAVRVPATTRWCVRSSLAIESPNVGFDTFTGPIPKRTTLQTYVKHVYSVVGGAESLRLFNLRPITLWGHKGWRVDFGDRVDEHDWVEAVQIKNVVYGIHVQAYDVVHFQKLNKAVGQFLTHMRLHPNAALARSRCSTITHQAVHAKVSPHASRVLRSPFSVVSPPAGWCVLPNMTIGNTILMALNARPKVTAQQLLMPSASNQQASDGATVEILHAGAAELWGRSGYEVTTKVTDPNNDLSDGDATIFDEAAVIRGHVAYVATTIHGKLAHPKRNQRPTFNAALAATKLIPNSQLAQPTCRHATNEMEFSVLFDAILP